MTFDIRKEDGETKGRFTVTVEGHEAELTYSKMGANRIIADHTDVPDALRGKKVGLALAEALVADARANGMTPTQMALAFCYTKWQVASTIIGVTSVAQLEEDLNAWGTTLSPEVLKAIDAIRWELRDPAL